MTKYAAFLRGISPLNANMRNEKLREVFERQGLEQVQTVITTGNVLFATTSTDIPTLEASIEKAFPEQLGFNSATFILSHAQLKQLAENHPFEPENKQFDQFVAFTRQTVKPDFPDKVRQAGYDGVTLHDRTVYCKVDTAQADPLALLRWLEKHFDKQITTRAWKTVERVLKRLDTL
jgi:uncharacterized protein (DUF1697 family)